jgi:hypothetical protein
LRNHEYFEELAAIAAVGELDPSQLRELNLHLTACARCKQANDEYTALHAVRPALGSEMIGLIESRRETVRAAFLQQIATSSIPAHENLEHRDKSPTPGLLFRNFRLLWSGIAAAAVIVFAFWAGTIYEHSVLTASGRVSAAGLSPVVQTTAAPSTATDNKQAEPAKLQIDVASELAKDLSEERQRSAALGAALNAKEHALMDSENERAALRQQLDLTAEESRRTQSLLAAKTEELSRTETSKLSDSNTLVALQYQVQDLTAKLNDQAQSLDRERQLLASGRDIRDIIVARNLHIIDVYDTDPEGRTKTSFARAFYTEGKSLIFYAYDLPTKRTEEGKFVYAAWGQKNGDKKKVQNLGILLNDDKGQKRWVLNFSDPKVLAEIDSVFITLERVGKDGDGPSGKRILTAYLESQPNHP